MFGAGKCFFVFFFALLSQLAAFIFNMLPMVRMINVNA